MASSEQQLRSDAEAQLRRLQQLNKPQALDRLKALDPYVFEHLVAVLFERRGYTATTMGGAGDEGVDVVLQKAGQGAVVQCKRYENNVGQPTVRDLYGTMMHNHAGEAYLVTTAMVTRQAEEWAQGKPIHLIDGYTLVDWIMQSRAGSRLWAPWSRAQPASTGARQTDAPRGSMRFVVLASITILIALFGFAVGIAYFRIEQRWGTAPSEEPATLAVSPALSTPATAPEPDGIEGKGDSLRLAPGTTTPADTLATAPIETVEPISCQVPVDPRLESLYNGAALGCASGDANMVWSAWQPFEGGSMLWRSDTDAAYAFLNSGEKRWFQVQERWDGKSPASRGEPPPGLQAPERGFGYVWGIMDDLFQALGWATDKEKGFCAVIQPFERGFALLSDNVGSCTPENLYNQATAADWKPLSLVALTRGEWSDVRPSPTANQGTHSPSGAPSGAAMQRPASHGTFNAPRARQVILDARFDEWSGTWTPLDAVAYGASNRSGSA